MVVHRQVGPVPGAGDAQALELGPLDVDPAFGKAAAFLAEGDLVHRVLVQTLGAVLLLDLPFDRQAVAIPAGHIAGVMAHHLLAAHHHVLEHLVQRMADVQVAVGIGGAVVQGERRAAGFLPQQVIDAEVFPALEPARLARGQARPHREIGFRQVQRVFVIGRVGAHLAGVPEENGGMTGGGAAWHTIGRRL